MSVESWMTIQDGPCGILGKVQVLGECLDGHVASFDDLFCAHGSAKCVGCVLGGDGSGDGIVSSTTNIITIPPISTTPSSSSNSPDYSMIGSRFSPFHFILANGCLTKCRWFHHILL